MEGFFASRFIRGLASSANFTRSIPVLTFLDRTGPAEQKESHSCRATFTPCERTSCSTSFFTGMYMIRPLALFHFGKVD
jgi:hypothetical protein